MRVASEIFRDHRARLKKTHGRGNYERHGSNVNIDTRVKSRFPSYSQRHYAAESGSYVEGNLDVAPLFGGCTASLGDTKANTKYGLLSITMGQSMLDSSPFTCSISGNADGVLGTAATQTTNGTVMSPPIAYTE